MVTGSSPRPVGLPLRRTLGLSAAALATALAVLTAIWCTSPALRRSEARHQAIHEASRSRNPDHGHLIGVLTFLGQWWLLAIATGVVATYLVLHLRHRRAALASLATGSVLLAVLLGKLLLVRSNTNNEWGLTLSGFPSGHTADATVLAGLLMLLVPGRPRIVPPLVAGAVLGAAVAWSRIEIGAHTVAEVIGGWLLGMTVLSLAVAVRIGEPRTEDRWAGGYRIRA